MPVKYEHIFFDLDKTLWDFDRNCEEALTEIAHLEMLERKGISISSFIEAYKEVNVFMWELHREGKADKESIRRLRFVYVLEKLTIADTKLAARLNELYIERALSKTHLIPHALEILDYLYPIYTLHIITNGFAESQKLKLVNSGLDKYFSNVVTCESAGCTKPDRKIFEFAIKKAGAKRSRSLMVGDHLEVDIIGARRVGMDQVYFNVSPLSRKEKITFHITSLQELRKIL